MPIWPKAEKQNISPQRRKGHEGRIFTTEAQRHGGSYKGKRCKAEAQRSRRKERCGLWIIRP
jgi:hypothetical protein